MSEIRVDNITDEAGTGSPAIPNGLPGSVLNSVKSGSIAQVKHITDFNQYFTTSTSYIDLSGLSNITFDTSLQSSSSKVLILFSGIGKRGSDTSYASSLTVFRDNTNLGAGFYDDGLILYGTSTATRLVLNYVDTPGNTTPSYSIKLRELSGGSTTSLGDANSSNEQYDQPSYLTLLEIAG